MNAKTEKKWALVTGASSGIGWQLALKAADAGYATILTARRTDKLQELHAEIAHTHGTDCHLISADLSTEEGVASLIDALKALGVPLSLFFNNAGFGSNGTFCEMEPESQTRMIDVNCRALVQLSHFVARQMKERNHGTIVHTASLGGLSPTPYYSVYGATKAFVTSFSLALAEELRETKVRVKVACPGATDTEFSKVSNFSGKHPGAANTQSSKEVADAVFAKLGETDDLIIPGLKNRIAAQMVRFLPRSWALRAAASSLSPN